MAKSKFDEMTDGAAPNPEPDDSQEPAGLSAQAVWSDTVDLSPDKLSIPFLTLVQGNSRLVADEKAKLGEWYVEGWPALKEVTIVPLQFGMSRRYSRDDGEGSQETACYAPTGPESQLHGIALQPDGPGMVCAECPLAKWQPTGETDERGRPKNSPPPCKESYDFLCWSVEHGIPVRVGFKSTSVRQGRLLATIAKGKGLGQFAVKLGSVKETRKFVYAVATVTLLTGESADNAIATGQAMMALGAGS